MHLPLCLWHRRLRLRRRMLLLLLLLLLGGRAIAALCRRVAEAVARVLRRGLVDDRHDIQRIRQRHRRRHRRRAIAAAAVVLLLAASIHVVVMRLLLRCAVRVLRGRLVCHIEHRRQRRDVLRRTAPDTRDTRDACRTASRAEAPQRKLAEQHARMSRLQHVTYATAWAGADEALGSARAHAYLLQS